MISWQLELEMGGELAGAGVVGASCCRLSSAQGLWGRIELDMGARTSWSSRSKLEAWGHCACPTLCWAG
ncbi:hypothetical protein CDL15_Pgr011056 [Punica granatum]|uniref:Uncharacterized protein n=1 Tax=Punica granatum TaxID=22663 RepID=A0A218XPN7_PUNGR|nr:hypothetical protein CDL15_Pgr011056 [Punica granatum]